MSRLRIQEGSVFVQTLFMTTANAMPRWDLDVFFPGLHSPEFQSGFDRFARSLTDLERLFDEGGVGAGDDGVVNDAKVRVLESVIANWNDLSAQSRILNCYISGFVTTDSRNDAALARASEMDPYLSRMRKLGKRMIAWLGALDTQAILSRSEIARAHRFNLEQAKVDAQHLMNPGEEALISDVEMTGSIAWSKLHGNVASQLEVEMDGQRLPMSVIRSLAFDPDPERRKKAYEAELVGWKSAEIPLAAAMNSIKGEAGLLSSRRGWPSPIDEACDSCNIDRGTLDAMMSAADAAFPMFRRYMHAKAKSLGTQKLAWYDMFAPIGEESRKWTFDEGASFVVSSFRTYSQKLSDFAARSFAERWTDAEPRAGKRDGAFCMSVRGDESRILMNFKPSFGSVSTLAHELGHAYHNVCLAERTQLQRQTPMTLAETASIFCETIIRQAVLNDGSPGDQLAVLEASLQGSCQVVVDISSRFLFEKWVFERRSQRELSARELCQLMLDSQRATYGDGLDQEILHPYMWAAKPHYYGRSFYNFPYMFGLLFGLGLYEIYEADRDAFRARYDELLSSTGLADAATLADGFGIDIRTSAFWEGSLRQIGRDVDRFESLSLVANR
jgi:pepF/M3 family oligoendopeptidase